MKENILDVLMYMFENYSDEEVMPDPEGESVKYRLARDGFHETVVDRAFTWLEGLSPTNLDITDTSSSQRCSIRLFTIVEQQKLNTTCRGFLLYLEQLGVLDPVIRELVIERIMALDGDEINIDQVKWVVQMVLFNRANENEEFAWAQGAFMAQMNGLKH